MAAGVYKFNTLSAFLRSTATETSMVNLKEPENFFNPYQQKVSNEVGGTQTALENRRGHFVKGSRKLEGGGEYLLLDTFSKQGTPPNNVPSVKSKYALLGLFNPIQMAGKMGDLMKARMEW